MIFRKTCFPYAFFEGTAIAKLWSIKAIQHGLLFLSVARPQPVTSNAHEGLAGSHTMIVGRYTVSDLRVPCSGQAMSAAGGRRGPPRGTLCRTGPLLRSMPRPARQLSPRWAPLHSCATAPGPATIQRVLFVLVPGCTFAVHGPPDIVGH